jgi:hypothetical protein
MQPSYARLMNVIYHQNREVRLDPELRKDPARGVFITEEQLDDFYSTKVRLFEGLGRELEIEEEPEAIN